jgi:hypothetical protein
VTNLRSFAALFGVFAIWGAGNSAWDSLGWVPGAQVLSGAVNGDNALTFSATRLPIDSRYAKIMRLM